MKVFLAQRAAEEIQHWETFAAIRFFPSALKMSWFDGNWNAICKSGAANISHYAADSNRPVTGCIQLAGFGLIRARKRILSQTIPIWPADSRLRI
jgi:hypothetical protein